MGRRRDGRMGEREMYDNPLELIKSGFSCYRYPTIVVYNIIDIS